MGVRFMGRIADAVLDRVVHNVSDCAQGPVATQGKAMTRPTGPWTLPNPWTLPDRWTRGRAHRSLQNRVDAVSHKRRPPSSSYARRKKQNEATDRN
jgi:hypothetical protein